MGKEIRAITYRLYPNKGQEIKMNYFLDATHNVYNRLVEICRSYIEKQLPFPTEFDLKNMTTKIRNRHEWMKDTHSCCCQAAAARVHNAFESWMKRHKEGVGFPRFKSWKMFDSFTYPSDKYFSFVGKNGEKEKRERFRLGKIGWLNVCISYLIRLKCKI